MGSGFSKMKKQAKVMQEKFAKMQEELKNLKVTGTSGSGLVEVTINGDKEVLSLNIKKECVDPEDIEGLQDLIIAAIADAHQKVEEQSPDNELQGLAPGLSGLL